jgi:hypothetical protein
MCARRVARPTSIRYSSSCHTRVNMSASIFFTAAMIRAFRISIHPCWHVCGNNLNIVSMCAVSQVVHTSIWYSSCCHTRVNMGASIIAEVKNIDAPMLTCVWQQLKYHVCRVNRGEHIEHLYLSKNVFSFSVAVNNSIKVVPLVFLL